MRADLSGNRLLVGSPTLMRQDGVELHDEAYQWVARLRAESKTVLCIAHNGVLIGVLASPTPSVPTPHPYSPAAGSSG